MVRCASFDELGAGIVGGAAGSGDICGFGFGLGFVTKIILDVQHRITIACKYDYSRSVHV